MTCVVGLEHDGTVWLGGDSTCNGEDSVMIQREAKVFTRGPYIIGFAGSFRVGAILRYIVDLPPLPKTGVDRMMVTDFASELRRSFTNEGLDTDKQADWDWSALVGIRSSLYCVEPDLHVWRHREKYAAIGTGALVALGAMHALSQTDLTAQQKIETALEGAAKYVPSVRGPWTLVSTRRQKQTVVD